MSRLEASTEAALDDLDDGRADGAKAAGRGIGCDRVRESEFVGPTPGRPKRFGRESLDDPIMFRKSERGTPEIRADSRKAGTPRLRPATDAEAGEMSAAFRPAIGAQEPPWGACPQPGEIGVG